MAQLTEKQWLDSVQSGLTQELITNEKALPPGFNRERFILNTITLIRDMMKDDKKKKELCKINLKTIPLCLAKGAYLGLDFFNGECYAIPYGGELQFQTDYKGEIKLCKKYSKNPIKDIYAKVVREGDFFEESIEGGVQNISFKPKPFSDESMIGAFAIAVFRDGSMMYDAMSKKEIEGVRNNYSKAKSSGAWVNSTGEMYKKTVLRRLCKLIDLNFDTIQQQVAYEDGGDVQFKNGQAVLLDGRKPNMALTDNGGPVDVFAQISSREEQQAQKKAIETVAVEVADTAEHQTAEMSITDDYMGMEEMASEELPFR